MRLSLVCQLLAFTQALTDAIDSLDREQIAAALAQLAALRDEVMA